MATSSFFGFVSKVSDVAATHLSTLSGSADASRTKDNRQKNEKQSVEQLQRSVPNDLDLHYITERLIAMSKPTDKNERIKSSIEGLPESPGPPPPQSVKPSEYENSHDPPTETTLTNNYMKLGRFLDGRHLKKNLILNVSDDLDTSKNIEEAFHYQILHLGWISAGFTSSQMNSKHASKFQTPSLCHLLNICYAITSYFSLSKRNIISVYCKNGKTRTGIVIACFLKFQKLVDTSLQGFEVFVSRRYNHLGQEKESSSTTNIRSQIPPSLKTLFQNFDTLMQYSSFPQTSPLLLRAITLQGVPVEEKPRIDIYDCSNTIVFSSIVNPEEEKQWVDEEGFYRVNKPILGDFILTCRFGGIFESDGDNATTLLFRYANNTGFLSRHGIYELPKTKVDMMKRYADGFDEDEFLVTLMFDEVEVGMELGRKLPEVFEGREAIEMGWTIIAESHCLNQNDTIKDSKVVVDLALKYLNHENNLEHSFQKNKAQSNVFSLSTNFKEDTDNFLNSLKFIDFGLDSSYIDETNSIERIPECSKAIESSWGRFCLNRPLPMPRRNDVIGAFDPNLIRYSNSYVISKFLDESVMKKNELQFAESHISQEHVHLPLSDRENQSDRSILTTAKKNIKQYIQSSISPSSTLSSKEEIWNFLLQQTNDKRISTLKEKMISGKASDAMGVLMALSHTGVNIYDLLDLQEDANEWAYEDDADVYEEEEDDWDDHSLSFDDYGMEEKRLSILRPMTPMANSRNDNGEVRLINEGNEFSPPTQNDKKILDLLNKNQSKAIENRNVDLKSSQPHLLHSIGEGSTEDVSRDDKLSYNGNGNGAPTQPEIASSSDNKNGDQVNLDEDDVPLKDHPQYLKFFKMLKFGLNVEAVRHALKKDGLDTSIIDLDPNKSLKNQTMSNKEMNSDDAPGVPIKDDPEYSKYFKMLKFGLSIGAVKHSLQKDGKDPTIIDLDPNKSFESQMKKRDKKGECDENEKDVEEEEDEEKDDTPPLKDDPEYTKYFKMLKMGLPIGAVKHSMIRDGKEPTIMDLDPNRSVISQLNEKDTKSNDPPLKDDPVYQKYFKMLKMGLPMDAVKHSMTRDGKDPSIMDLDPNKSVKSQSSSNDDSGLALKDDPEWEKYFRMLKMGLPLGAVQHAATRDGMDPSILELDPNRSIACQKGTGKKKKKSDKKSKKKKLRRKKVYWSSFEKDEIHKESLWKMVENILPIEQLKYDTQEFESLFTEDSNANKTAVKVTNDKTKVKKSFQVVDAKRAQNGGILFSRIKIPFPDIAQSIESMIIDDLNVTQLKAFMEFLPSEDEEEKLKEYLEKGEPFDDLCVAEKYMVAIMKGTKHPKKKLESMIYVILFQNRLDEVLVGVNDMIKACDEVRGSSLLRSLMIMILRVVNHINTGGEEEKHAAGYNLNALIELDKAKAFDKKTTVLQYLITLIKKNDASLLQFKDELPSIDVAVRVSLDAVGNDLEDINKDFKAVKETVTEMLDQSIKSKLETEVNVDKDKIELKVTESPSLNSEEESNKKVYDENNQDSIKDCQVYSLKEKGLDEKVSVDDSEIGTKSDHPMQKFVERAEIKIKKAFEKNEEMKEKYKCVIKYFGEDEALASDELFGTIQQFIKLFYAAYDHIDKMEKMKLREEKLAKKKKSRVNTSVRNLATISGTNDEAIEAMGPLASAAAAAALAMKNKKSSKTTQIPSEENSKKEMQNETPSTPSPVSTLNIGLMAALAAKRKNNKNNDLNVERADGGNGVINSPNQIDSSEETNKKSSMESVDRGIAKGIAEFDIGAAAAMSARKKISARENVIGVDSKKESIDYNTDENDENSHKPMNIAEAAALAARKKGEQTKENVNSNGDTQTKKAPIGLNIAQAAATAAKKIGKKHEIPSPPMEFNVAEAAAHAAQKKNIEESDSQKAHCNGLNIAEAAAFAARKKNAGQSKLKVPIGVNIAEAAASAARKKNESQKAPIGLNIAEAAASAARKKIESQKAPIGLNIAEAAASAARKKKEDEMKNNQAGFNIAEVAADAARKRSYFDSGTKDPLKGLNIADAAALAARTKMKEGVELKNSALETEATKVAKISPKESMKGKLEKTPSGLNLAEAAALAARTKNHDVNEVTKAPVGFNIAEAAASAARKKKNGEYSSKMVDVELSMAEVAASRARKNSFNGFGNTHRDSKVETVTPALKNSDVMQSNEGTDRKINKDLPEAFNMSGANASDTNFRLTVSKDVKSNDFTEHKKNGGDINAPVQFAEKATNPTFPKGVDLTGFPIKRVQSDGPSMVASSQKLKSMHSAEEMSSFSPSRLKSRKDLSPLTRKDSSPMDCEGKNSFKEVGNGGLIFAALAAAAARKRNKEIEKSKPGPLAGVDKVEVVENTVYRVSSETFSGKVGNNTEVDGRGGPCESLQSKETHDDKITTFNDSLTAKSKGEKICYKSQTEVNKFTAINEGDEQDCSDDEGGLRGGIYKAYALST